mmetsp:Transcript_15141/g.24696  ORF Transcript_15141/g.24696 Transcript_15141/m.24696 type:complete len:671 (-) Transcript_15141:392-2404(-)
MTHSYVHWSTTNGTEISPQPKRCLLKIKRRSTCIILLSIAAILMGLLLLRNERSGREGERSWKESFLARTMQHPHHIPLLSSPLSSSSSPSSSSSSSVKQQRKWTSFSFLSNSLVTRKSPPPTLLQQMRRQIVKIQAEGRWNNDNNYPYDGEQQQSEQLYQQQQGVVGQQQLDSPSYSFQSQSYSSSSPADATTVLSEDGKPPCKIKVVGIGGGGGNTVNRMIEYMGMDDAYDSGVEFWSINTDVQALSRSLAGNRIQIGPEETKGLGAGSKPEVGKIAAEESAEVIGAIVRDTDMVFVTAGMGGGTGSGAAPVVAAISKHTGCLTVGVVTKPFHFEGKKRLRQAREAIQELRKHVDILIVVSNDKLLEVAPTGMALQDAFAQADDILRQGIVGISEIITKPGLINVDFADVNSVMSNAGLALMGIGVGSGPSRAQDAAMAAITSPLLDFPLENAKGVVYTINGGPDMSLQEVNRVAEVIAEMVHPEANVIFGASTDESMGNSIKVVVVATNFENSKQPDVDTEYDGFNSQNFSPGSAGFSAFGTGSGLSSPDFSATYTPADFKAGRGGMMSAADAAAAGSSARNSLPTDRSNAYYSMDKDSSGSSSVGNNNRWGGDSNGYYYYDNSLDKEESSNEQMKSSTRQPQADEKKSTNKRRRRGLGGWWYWWRN